MSELQLTEMILLMLVAWALIVLIVKDIVLTARNCLIHSPANFAAGSRKTFDARLVRLLAALPRSFKPRASLLKRLNVIVPLLQLAIWKAGLLVGFAVLYLAIGAPPQTETLSDDKLNDFIDAVRLSLAVAFRLALYDPGFQNPSILLVANVQFYSGFLFSGFVCFYLLTLRRKARRLKPYLYKLRYEIDDLGYSPLVLADSLREYENRNLLLILEDWERWAERLRVNLRLHRQFVYSGVPAERNAGWLAALSIILDSSAALIVSADGAIEKKARETFRAARRALVEIGALVVSPAPENADETACFRAGGGTETDEILSAPLLIENEEFADAAAPDSMFNVWRFTYEKSLRSLADELEAEIPSIKYAGQFC